MNEPRFIPAVKWFVKWEDEPTIAWEYYSPVMAQFYPRSTQN